MVMIILMSVSVCIYTLTWMKVNSDKKIFQNQVLFLVLLLYYFINL